MIDQRIHTDIMNIFNVLRQLGGNILLFEDTAAKYQDQLKKFNDILDDLRKTFNNQYPPMDSLYFKKEKSIEDLSIILYRSLAFHIFGFVYCAWKKLEETRNKAMKEISPVQRKFIEDVDSSLPIIEVASENSKELQSIFQNLNKTEEPNLTKKVHQDSTNLNSIIKVQFTPPTNTQEQELMDFSQQKNEIIKKLTDIWTIVEKSEGITDLEHIPSKSYGLLRTITHATIYGTLDIRIIKIIKECETSNDYVGLKYLILTCEEFFGKTEVFKESFHDWVTTISAPLIICNRESYQEVYDLTINIIKNSFLEGNLLAQVYTLLSTAEGNMTEDFYKNEFDPQKGIELRERILDYVPKSFVCIPEMFNSWGITYIDGDMYISSSLFIDMTTPVKKACLLLIFLHEMCHKIRLLCQIQNDHSKLDTPSYLNTHEVYGSTGKYLEKKLFEYLLNLDLIQEDEAQLILDINNWRTDSIDKLKKGLENCKYSLKSSASDNKKYGIKCTFKSEKSLSSFERREVQRCATNRFLRPIIRFFFSRNNNHEQKNPTSW